MIQGQTLLRGRALLYLIVTSAFAVLMTIVTVRFVTLSNVVGSLLVVGLTAGLWYRAWLWYKAFRAGSVS